MPGSQTSWNRHYNVASQQNQCVSLIPDGDVMGATGGVKPVGAGFPPQFAEYLDSLLSSPPFDSSPRRAELLRYLLTKSFSGQGNTLSEYAIALDVFRKPESFDQRIDSIVRSEVSRLRKMVAAYYEGSGVTDRWRIVFPPRGYFLQIEEIAPAAVEPPAPAPPPALPHNSRWLAVLYALAFAAFAVFCATEYRAARNPATRNAPSTPSSAHVPTLAARAEYMKGQYYWEHRTGSSLQEAADAYTQAIVADSDYAAAYAGLAETYDLMPEYSAMSQTSAFSRAITTANKAISLDPSISVAHRALAFGLFWSQTDIPRAFAEFQRAIQLAPNDAEAHHWYATALNAVQRNAEALSEINLAQQLTPASRSILADQAWIRYSSADDRQAKAALEELEEREPDFRSPPAYLARIDLSDGDYAGYLAQLRRLAALSGNAADARIAAAAQRGWVLGGVIGMLRAIQSVQKDSLSKGQSDGYDLAHTCGMLGEKEDAVHYLQGAFAANDIFVLDALRQDWAPPLTGYPPFESLRDQVRRHFGIEKGGS
jgi:tetratricopeptide (TPR) repeat protein